MAKQLHFETQPSINTLILGIDVISKKRPDPQAYFDEFLSLVTTYGVPTDHVLSFRLRSIDGGYFLTGGKLDEVKKYCQEHNISQVILSESISPQQERNLSDYLNCTIIDRTRLILEIFHNAAQSAEGKTQVAIALLQHEKTRLTGKGVHLAQQVGAIGTRGGPGETLKEQERRQIENAIHTLKKRLRQIQQTRETQRKKRRSSGLPHFCLIGYTNAGKSTILNTLTKSDVLAKDILFATLDPTTRELFLGPQKNALLSDTVGFIQELPTKLVEAFKSTLEELQYADLLLHVVDLSNKSWQAHIQVVNELLADIKVNKPILYVFNKLDRATDINPNTLDQYQPQVTISATSKEGIAPLLEYLRSWYKTNS